MLLYHLNIIVVFLFLLSTRRHILPPLYAQRACHRFIYAKVRQKNEKSTILRQNDNASHKIAAHRQTAHYCDALRNGPFRTAKWPISYCETAHFTAQNGPFCNTKWAILQHTHNQYTTPSKSIVSDIRRDTPPTGHPYSTPLTRCAHDNTRASPLIAAARQNYHIRAAVISDYFCTFARRKRRATLARATLPCGRPRPSRQHIAHAAQSRRHTSTCHSGANTAYK